MVINIRKFEKPMVNFQCSSKGRKRLLVQVIGGRGGGGSKNRGSEKSAFHCIVFTAGNSAGIHRVLFLVSRFRRED